MNQLQGIALKMVMSMPALRNNVMVDVVQLRQQINQLKRDLTAMTKDFSQMFRDLLRHVYNQERIMSQKDSQVSYLRKVMEETRERNSQFLQTIKMQFKKKDDLVNELERQLKTACNRTKGEPETLFAQCSLPTTLHIIEQVTQTLTTQEDIESLTQKFTQMCQSETSSQASILKMPEEQSTRSSIQMQSTHEFRQDLETFLKLSRDTEKQNRQVNVQKKKNNFIKQFRHSVQNLQQITVQFPTSASTTLLPLSERGENVEKYIGNYQYQGNFSHGSRNGYGILRKNKKLIYSGEWVNGMFDGWGRLMLCTSKFIHYQGTFSKGNFDGRGTLLLSNGDSYVGEVKNNMVDGEGTLTRGQQRITGRWSKNKLIQRY